jgi:hypothetical protein
MTAPSQPPTDRLAEHGVVDDALAAPALAERAPGDLPLADFLAHAHQLVEWIGRYLAEPERYAVVARVAPGDVRAQLPESPPVQGESLADILGDIERVIVPGVTHWNHPGFFAYFSISAASPASSVRCSRRRSTSTRCSGRPGPRRRSWSRSRSTGCGS